MFFLKMIVTCKILVYYLNFLIKMKSQSIELIKGYARMQFYKYCYKKYFALYNIELQYGKDTD